MKCRKCGKDAWIGVETMLCDECKRKPAKPVTRTPQDFAPFLESLKVKNEGLDKHPEWNFKQDIEILYFSFKELGGLGDEAIEYLFERCFRAESNAKPPTLVEDVKAFVRAGMDATLKAHLSEPQNADDWYEFRKLCKGAKP